MKRSRKIIAMEFWLQHVSDPSKDIRCYAYTNREESDFAECMRFISKADYKHFYGHVNMRGIMQPKTKREKAIYRSQR